MKVKEFYEKYSASDNKQSVLEKIMNDTKYMPLEYKMLRTEMIIKQANHSPEGAIKISRTMVNTLFNKMLIECYTNLEFAGEGEDFFADYNILAEHEIIEAIIALIPKKEVETLEEMLWDAFEDMLDTEKHKDKFAEIIGLIASGLENLPLDKLLEENGEA